QSRAFSLRAEKNQFVPNFGIALTESGNFALLQSRAAFAKLLAQLGLPQPSTRFITSRSRLEAMNDFPYYVKAPYSTAGCGVWRVGNGEARPLAISRLGLRGLLGGRPAVCVADVGAWSLSHAPPALPPPPPTSPAPTTP